MQLRWEHHVSAEPEVVVNRTAHRYWVGCWRGCTKKLTQDLLGIKLPIAQPFKSKYSLPIRNHQNAVAQLVQALRYSECRGFDFRSCNWDFVINLILLTALWIWGRLRL